MIIKLTIAYDGTNYRGWQLQKNGHTIQGEIEKAIYKVFKKKHRIYGAGRTDAGVHAEAQVAHFKAAAQIPIEKLASALNRVLPKDITIVKVEEADEKFHAQFDAKSKHYRYYIHNSQYRDPFKERYSWQVSYKLNMALMKKEIVALRGKHDFKSFQASDKKERSSQRKIFDISIKKSKSMITIDVKGDGFLYNMVRNIVGTLVEIGRGYLPPGSMEKILKTKDRTIAGPTAPAKGLFLVEINYQKNH